MPYTITDGTTTLWTATLLRDPTFSTYTRGAEMSLAMTFPDTTEYETALTYTEYIGASSYGRTLGGDVFFIESVSPNAPVTSHVVKVETPTVNWNYPDFWVLLIDAQNATPPPGTDYRIDFTAVFLAEGSEYSTRADVVSALGASVTG